MVRRPQAQTTIRLLPTDTQRASLDDTWARLGRLMNIVDNIMICSGDIAHTAIGSAIVSHLLETEDGQDMSTRMLDSCVRTVSRHYMAHQDDLDANRIDWTTPPEELQISITGSMVSILRSGDASIQTATGRDWPRLAASIFLTRCWWEIPRCSISATGTSVGCETHQGITS